ncbi:unnamed protein product, partial [Ectocarpus sp. 12 AP-2014]
MLVWSAGAIGPWRAEPSSRQLNIWAEAYLPKYSPTICELFRDGPVPMSAGCEARGRAKEETCFLWSACASALGGLDELADKKYFCVWAGACLQYTGAPTTTFPRAVQRRGFSHVYRVWSRSAKNTKRSALTLIDECSWSVPR